MEGLLHYIALFGPSWSYTCWSFNPLLEYLSHQTLFWLSVSCGSQCSTVQRSSRHKCGQKSSCSAFNAMVAAFPWIFLGFLLSRKFVRHVPIIGASWRVILTAGIDILAAFIISEEEFLLGPRSFRSLLMRLQTGTPNNSLFLLGPFNVFGKSPRPNIWSWAFIPTIAPQNSGFSLSFEEKKWGLDF